MVKFFTEPPFPKHQGENVKLLRHANGLSQAKLAQALGVHQSMVSLVENGEEQFSKKEIQRLAKMMGVTPAFFDGPKPCPIIHTCKIPPWAG